MDSNVAMRILYSILFNKIFVKITYYSMYGVLCIVSITEEPVLKDHLMGLKSLVYQDRLCLERPHLYLMIGSITFKCKTFCQEYLVLSKMVVFHGSAFVRQVSLYNITCHIHVLVH